MAFSSLPIVYLCGPITGQSAAAAKNWRADVAAALDGVAACIDPTRDMPDFARHNERPQTFERFQHGKRTVTRDRFDVARSDIIFACFLGSEKVSIGSVGEIFWADAMRRPVIIVREDKNIHNHDMLNEIAGWIFSEMTPAIDQVKRLIATE